MENGLVLNMKTIGLLPSEIYVYCKTITDPKERAHSIRHQLVVSTIVETKNLFEF